MTATPAHTPLPWKHQAGFQNVYALSGGDVGLTIHIAKTNEEQVAGGYAEAEANAAFIVRACNSHYQLVDVLRELADVLEHDCDCPPCVGSMAPAEHALGLARDILATLSQITGEA